MKTILIAMATLALAGCGSFEEARSPRVTLGAAAPARDTNRCNSLDGQHRAWGGAAAGAGFASGAAGLATIPVKDDNWKLGLAITSVAAGTASAISVFVSQDASTAWARECSTP